MRKIVIIIFSLIVVYGCKEIYNPDIISPDTGYLVVEGFINSGSSGTTIKLSRTKKLNDRGAVIAENNAKVYVESDKNEVFTLLPYSGGTYAISSLSLNPVNKYRVKIITANGSEYVSDFTNVKTTPAIDSVAWKKENGGIQIFIHSHDETNNTHFYQWKYTETWEFHSTFTNALVYITDPITNGIMKVGYKFAHKGIDWSIYQCWQSFSSSNLLLGSTEKLAKDVVYMPVTFVEKGSIKMAELYSIEVQQFALSAAAYRFYLQMKKNTEQLGSIFDAQPSDMKGNINCTTNPSEIVIGYVEVSQQQSKRIFIARQWNYSNNCQSILIDNNKDSIAKYGGGLLPTYPEALSASGEIISFNASRTTCVDCTLTGTNVKPSFWP